MFMNLICNGILQDFQQIDITLLTKHSRQIRIFLNAYLQWDFQMFAFFLQEATQALLAATTTPKHHHVAENDDDENDEELLNNGDTSRDLRNDDDDINDPVNDRLTLAERNERLQSQLRSLKDELSHTRDETGETTMDRIHKENVKQGRDKYKTLREVRKGNTKRRVDQFENM